MNLRAIKHGQTLELLDPLDLPDGEIAITIQTPLPETFWNALQTWRTSIDWETWDDRDPWTDVRDSYPGRELNWDD